MQSNLSMEDQQVSSATMKKTLLFLNCIFLAIGNTAGPLIMRLYFIRGGKRIWLSSWLETGGFPVISIPLLVLYRRRRSKEGPNAKLFLMRPRLLIATVFIGLLTGIDDYFYAGGMGRLPVSTQALIIAAQLAFTAIFTFFLVKQRFTPYSINAVVLLTVGAGVLALHTNGDRPKGETKRDYIVGFLMTVTAALLYAFILPLVEWSYMKAKQRVTYTLVLEVQLVVCFFATVVCTVGMLINKDFQAIPLEARNFKQGEATYYTLLVCTGLIWQFFYLGIVGVIFCASSLLSAIIIAVLLPVTETLAVICFHEKFQSEKGLALALSLWGFISYFYGEMRHGKLKTSHDQEIDMTETDDTP